MKETPRGTVSLVTGAQQGIGEVIARRLAAEGSLVAVNDRHDTELLSAVVESIQGVSAVADVADREQVARMVAGVEAEHGPVQTLVCNAAVEVLGTLLEQPPEVWWSHIDVNVTGTYNVIQEVLPGMRRNGGGRIVIIASIWGTTGWPRASGYSASKSGLIALTRSLGRELAPDNVFVNAIAPGIIDSPQIQIDADDAGISLDDMRARYAVDIPAGRLGTTEEIAATVAFLASAASGAFVGQILQPNGGELRGPA